MHPAGTLLYAARDILQRLQNDNVADHASNSLLNAQVHMDQKSMLGLKAALNKPSAVGKTLFKIENKLD